MPRVRLRNSTPALVNRLLLGGYGAAGGGGDGAGGGKYIMPLVKLSFYDHFMVARGPSMLSTYRCAFLAAVLCATRRHRNIVIVFGNSVALSREILGLLDAENTILIVS